MRQRVEFSESDEGKRVVNADGDEIRRVVDVRHGSAYVDPDADIFERIKSKLGWGNVDEDAYPLQKADVADITPEEIRLRRL